MNLRGMNVSRVSVGIFGSGRLSEMRENAFARHPDYNISEVYTLFELSEIAQNSNNLETLIADSVADLIHISLPGYLASNVIKYSLQHSKSVFVDLISLMGTEDILRIIEFEQEFGHKVRFGLNYRHYPAIEEAMSIISTNKYGKLNWLRGRVGNIQYFMGDKDQSGGTTEDSIWPLFRQGLHLIDITLLFCGQIQSIKAVVADASELADSAEGLFTIMRADSGCIIELNMVSTALKHQYEIELFFDKAHIMLTGGQPDLDGIHDEEIGCAIIKTPSPMAIHADKDIRQFKNVDAMLSDLTSLHISIINNEKIIDGSSSDVLQIMRAIDGIRIEVKEYL